MDRQQHRAIQQMTRWTLVMLQNAERGLLPPTVLRRAVDPQVLKAMGPFSPHRPGQAHSPPRVGRLRVQLVHDGLAHVACVAPRPDGTPAAYVLEFRRPTSQQAWRITELTRAEERRLVGPEASTPQGAGTDGNPRRLPGDLTGRITAARKARADAAAALEAARAKLRQLPDPLPGMKTSTFAQRMKRDPHMQERDQARRDVARWQQALVTTTEELKELYEVREARELRQRALRGDPLMRVRQWGHLDRLLGPVPKEPEERAHWRHAVSAVETYRNRWHITDPEQALGKLSADAPSEQRAHHRAAAEVAHAYTAARRQELPLDRKDDDLELSL